MRATTQALKELEQYCDMAVSHSYNQYEKHGTLHSKAIVAFGHPTLWQENWVPEDFDICEARTSPVWSKFSAEQRLAWNHLQWVLDYSAVAMGEKQLIVLNEMAARDYQRVIPKVVELEKRESFEEQDHIDSFATLIDAVGERYFHGKGTAIWSVSASGFVNERFNRVARRVIGKMGRYLLGSNFPTLYFLARGMKTHGFKPFENAISMSEACHPAIRSMAHLHRLDESRHMATSLNLTRLSTSVLDTLPKDNRIVFKAACEACFPHGRSAEYRLSYWRRVLDQARIYADVSSADKEALYKHLGQRLNANLESLHEIQGRLTRQANKRIVEECGLSPDMKRIFVQHMRADPAYSATVDAVQLEM